MDETRRRILERRATFVAAALAAVSVEACSKPRACLDVPYTEIKPDDAVAKPKAEEDAGMPSGSVGVGDSAAAVDADANETKPVPHVCLSIAPRRDAGPSTCLSY